MPPLCSRYGEVRIGRPSQLYRLGLNHRYDRELGERMIHCLGVYPVGSLVELNTGERGTVGAIDMTALPGSEGTL